MQTNTTTVKTYKTDKQGFASESVKRGRIKKVRAWKRTDKRKEDR